MYIPVQSSGLIEALIHLRDLFRRTRPSNEPEVRAFQRREAATKELLSNLPRIGEHPTLRTLLELAEIYSLTLESAHKLFGYEINRFQEYDLALNGGRTHIFESYPFQRDLLVDLPARLAGEESFAIDAFVRDLVVEWQTGVPIRALEEEGWEQPGAFYVHIGTEDSFGSSLPPGAVAKVEPISEAEKVLPHPRRIYLLQFGDGYRCSHCVVTNGKLRPFNSGRAYLGREGFPYPGSVRIAGRIRMFSLSLPVPELPIPATPPLTQRRAELVLPWEHGTRGGLLLAKHRRFVRSKEEESRVHDFLQELLQTKLSGRSERRYRGPTTSDPHVNALIQLSLGHMARYTDILRTGGSWQTDRGRFTLEGLLEARSLSEALSPKPNLRTPTPNSVWEARRSEFGGWSPLLSARFPRLQQWEDKIVRLAQGAQITGIDPTLKPGSLLLLDETPSIPDAGNDRAKFGWGRPIYVFQRGLQIVCGILERDGDRFALLSGVNGAVKASFGREGLSQLRRVTGIAVPV